MPNVIIRQFPRDVDKKRRLAATITQAIVDIYEIGPEHVEILFDEFTTENWASSGKLWVDAHK
jgi:4-oxalocrotonate tautomerase